MAIKIYKNKLHKNKTQKISGEICVESVITDLTCRNKTTSGGPIDNQHIKEFSRF